MDSFEFWLRRMESKVERMSYRPSTREEASDLFDLTKVIKSTPKNHKFIKKNVNLQKSEVEKTDKT